MALSKPIGDVIAEELECSICLDRLQSPRMLTCLHSFCEHCLQDCIDQTLDGFLHCPTCRECSAIPNVGITGFKPDFRAKKLLEALDKNRSSMLEAPNQLDCSMCRSFVACLICKKCDFKICQGCSEFSNPNWPTCRNHPGLPMMNVSAGESQKVDTRVVLPKCPRHAERLKFYCKSCKICICADCTVLDHSKVDGHECVYLKEIMPQLRREVDELAAQVSIKAKDLDSFSAKIGATKEELYRKSSDIDQEIETEVANIKAMLLEHSHYYIEKNREHVYGIEQRNAAAKEAVQNVARRLRQAASSKDDIKVADMHQRLQTAVRKIMDSGSEASTLDKLQTKLDTFRLKRTHDESALHFSLNLVQKERVLEKQDMPNSTGLCAVGTKANDTLSVIFKTQTGQLSCRNVQRKPELAVPDSSHGGFTDVRYKRSSMHRCRTRHVLRSSAVSSSGCQYLILPNEQICFIKGDKLCKGTAEVALHALSPNKGSRINSNISQVPCMAVDKEGCIYIAAAGLDYLLKVAPNDAVLLSKPIGTILPFAITTCPTSTHETILVIAHKPASVSLVDSQQKIQCIFNAREEVVWENAAVACGHDGRVYLLSSQRSKLSLQVLDMAGNLKETVFSDRPVSSLKQSGSTLNVGFGCVYSAATAGSFGLTQSASAKSTSSQEKQGPCLSIAVAPSGDIAAVLGENELVLITLEERDVRKT